MRPGELVRVPRINSCVAALDQVWLAVHGNDPTRGRDGMKLTGIGWILAGIVSTVAVQAHDPGISTSQGELKVDSLTLITGFGPADVEQLLPAAFRRVEKWSQTGFDCVRDHLR